MQDDSAAAGLQSEFLKRVNLKMSDFCSKKELFSDRYDGFCDNFFANNSAFFELFKEFIKSSDNLDIDFRDVKKNSILFKLVDYYEENSLLMRRFRDLIGGSEKSDNVINLCSSALARILDVTTTRWKFKEFVPIENTDLVVILTRGGFANKIRSLVAGKVVSKLLNMNFRYIWIEDSSCPADISDIFSTHQLQSHKYIRFDASDLLDYLLIRDTKALVFDQLWPAWTYFEKILSPRGLQWDLFYKTYRMELGNLFEQLKLDIVEAISCTSIGIDFNSCIGLHVRGTDFLEHYKKVYPDRRLASAEDFMSAITQACSSLEQIDHYYLATDDVMSRNFFCNNLGSKLITGISSFKEGNLRQTSVPDAVVDLIILSRCKIIIGTYGSSFNELASDIGGSPIFRI